jgi:Rps23 Pro-64 3,4-dihydroxylase Tpa1-like proline 4-hydroxylase
MDLSDEVELTLLLAGGQQYTLSVSADEPLLRELFEVLVDAEGKSGRLFQIPIQKGRSTQAPQKEALLTFRGDRLVALITEPPILIETSLPQSDPLASDYVQIDQFLTPSDHDRLINFVLQQEANFVSTSTSTGDLDYRKSLVLYAFPEFSQLISQQIHAVLPNVLTQLSLPHFDIQQVEAQLTAHNDGNYYKIHNDNGSSHTTTRELTYVYYFNRQPKAFSGGELRIYDTTIKNNQYVQAETHHTIEPRDNSIVFFLSRYMHEVLPILCPSQTFADSRFTLNGWIRR